MIEALAVLIGLLIAPYLLIGRRETRDAAALADGAVTRIASRRPKEAGSPRSGTGDRP